MPSAAWDESLVEHERAMKNGVQFTNRKQDTTAFDRVFDRVCWENGIEHRLTKIAPPWTNGRVERMNRTLKAATVKRDHYDTHDQLKTQLSETVDADNYARRLKTLKRLSPCEDICKIWTSEPERFNANLALSRLRSGLSTHLCSLTFECQALPGRTCLHIREGVFAAE